MDTCRREEQEDQEEHGEEHRPRYRCRTTTTHDDKEFHHRNRSFQDRSSSTGSTTHQICLGEDDEEDDPNKNIDFGCEGRKNMQTINGPEVNFRHRRILHGVGPTGTEQHICDDGCARMRNHRAHQEGRESDGCLQNDQMGQCHEECHTNGHGQDCTAREEPHPLHHELWKLQTAKVRKAAHAVLQLPEVWTPSKDVPQTDAGVSLLCTNTRVHSMQGRHEHRPPVRQLQGKSRYNITPMSQEVSSRRAYEERSQGVTNPEEIITSKPMEEDCSGTIEESQDVCPNHGRFPGVQPSQNPSEECKRSNSGPGTNRNTEGKHQKRNTITEDPRRPNADNISPSRHTTATAHSRATPRTTGPSVEKTRRRWTGNTSSRESETAPFRATSTSGTGLNRQDDRSTRVGAGSNQHSYASSDCITEENHEWETPADPYTEDDDRSGIECPELSNGIKKIPFTATPQSPGRNIDHELHPTGRPEPLLFRATSQSQRSNFNQELHQPGGPATVLSRASPHSQRSNYNQEQHPPGGPGTVFFRATPHSTRRNINHEQHPPGDPETVFFRATPHSTRRNINREQHPPGRPETVFFRATPHSTRRNTNHELHPPGGPETILFRATPQSPRRVNTEDDACPSMPSGTIKIVHWNAEGANRKTAVIQAAILQDELDILMIQDTRYQPRPDGLPSLRISGYHTYHRPKIPHGDDDVANHGLVTLVKHTIPSEEADQIDFGRGTESLTVRIWINQQPLLLHNVYRTAGDLDILGPLNANPRALLLGDLNARHEVWCRGHNTAGQALADQLLQLDTLSLLNPPRVWTTTNDTVIDLAIVPNDMAATTEWSIYPQLLSDHLAVLLTVRLEHQRTTVPVPKRWLTQQADWPTYGTNLLELNDQIQWQDLDTNTETINGAILQAASSAIPKSSGRSSQRPYWRNNLGVQMAKSDYNFHLHEYRKQPSQDRLHNVRQSFGEFTDLCSSVRNQSWQKWIEECNTLNTHDIWRRIKTSTGAAPRPPTHPEPKQEADTICERFTQRCSLQNLPQSTVEQLADDLPRRLLTIRDACTEEKDTNQIFTLSELEAVLVHLKDTTPGEDTICYSMIRNTPLAFRHTFLKLINQSFVEGRLPEQWKIAKVIPIPKKEKGTYRPISLLPVLSKVMERMVLNRIKWSAHPFHNMSMGFRPGVGTMDAIATLLQHVSPIKTYRNGHSTRTVAIFLDLEKAFELVSAEVILECMIKQGIGGKLLIWVRDFLHQRKGAVHFQGHDSEVGNFTNGTPQGSSLSPTLFNMVINQLLKLDMGHGIYLTAYADDLVLYGSGDSEDTIWDKMTTALGRLETKATQLGLNFSPTKCEAMWFRANNPTWHFRIGGQIIPWKSVVKYLGVMVDKRLTFRQQADYVKQKASTKMNALKVVSSLSGVNGTILRRMYTASVQSCIEYGSMTFGMMAESNIKKIQTVQNQGMRLILGVPSRTSAIQMGMELQMLPVKHRAILRRATFHLKLLTQPNHPLHQKAIQAPRRRRRLDWNGEMHACYNLAATNGAEMEPLIWNNMAPWDELPYTCRIHWLKDSPELCLQNALEFINNAPPHITAVYYTDGSCDGRHVAAAYVTDAEEMVFRLNDTASVVDAELTAILLAIGDAHRRGHIPIIHTDSMTAVKILDDRHSAKTPTADAIRRIAARLQRKPIINWVPAHRGIPGNERADAAAKSGLQLQTVDRHVPCSKYRTRKQMSKTIKDHHTEEIYAAASANTQLHRELFQSNEDRKKLLSIPRNIQKQIHRLRLRSPTYSQVCTRFPLECQYCEEDIICIADHWLQDCDAMAQHHLEMMNRLGPNHRPDGRQLSTDILNNQAECDYNDLQRLLRRYPLPSPSS